MSRKVMRNSIAVVSALLITLVLSACGGQNNAGTSDAQQGESAQTVPVPDTPTITPDALDDTDDDQAATSGRIDAVRAAEIALGEVSGAVVEIESSQEAGRPIWEVIVRQDNGAGTEVYIDAATGNVIRQEPGEVPSEAVASAPEVSVERAIETALNTVKGTLVEIEVGEEAGRPTWEAIVAASDGRRTEIYIDAATGAVVKQEAAD